MSTTSDAAVTAAKARIAKVRPTRKATRERYVNLGQSDQLAAAKARIASHGGARVASRPVVSATPTTPTPPPSN